MPQVAPATINPHEGRIIHAPMLVNIIKDTIRAFAAFARLNRARSRSMGGTLSHLPACSRM